MLSMFLTFICSTDTNDSSTNLVITVDGVSNLIVFHHRRMDLIMDLTQQSSLHRVVESQGQLNQLR